MKIYVFRRCEETLGDVAVHIFAIPVAEGMSLGPERRKRWIATVGTLPRNDAIHSIFWYELSIIQML
jgi:hypothetical protein